MMAAISTDVEQVIQRLRTAAGEALDELERWAPSALGGDERAARRYVRAWRTLVRRLIGEADASRSGSTGLDLFDHLALTAPFSTWTTAHGPGLGAALALVSQAGPMLPDMEPLAPPAGRFPDLDAWDVARFERHVWLALLAGPDPLARVAAAWDLTQTDVARLFGVTRQAIAQWLDEGTPPARQPKLLAISRVADLLERNLLPERIPAIVREPAEAYGGRSMLEEIEVGRYEELFESVRGSFDWAATA